MENVRALHQIRWSLERDDMNGWLQVSVTIVGSLIASSGFWAFMQFKSSNRNNTDRLIQGIAYDKIVSMGMDYIRRGWITNDEYEDYRKRLYDPYKALGGNGVTERVMAEVTSLPLRSRDRYVEVLQEAKAQQPVNDRYEDANSGVLIK